MGYDRIRIFQYITDSTTLWLSDSVIGYDRTRFFPNFTVSEIFLLIYP